MTVNIRIEEFTLQKDKVITLAINKQIIKNGINIPIFYIYYFLFVYLFSSFKKMSISIKQFTGFKSIQHNTIST